MKLKKRILILSLVFSAAVCLALYPFFANIHNNKLAQSLVAAYEENISGIDEEVLEDAFNAALSYNIALNTGSVTSLYSNMSGEEIYENLLNLNNDGIMGYIEIPSIDVSLPIYHGTEEEVLKKGAGHLEGTALPVGGTSSRCVIAGHRGLPGSRLFTDLDLLETGDVFYLHVLGETLAYEVTSIEVVSPEDADSVSAVSGQDLCTLLTCTPYGINTHRLLITGTRTEYIEAGEDAAASGLINIFSRDYILLYAACAELAVYICLLYSVIKKRKGQA